MYHAPILAFGLVLLGIYRSVLNRLERRLWAAHGWSPSTVAPEEAPRQAFVLHGKGRPAFGPWPTVLLALHYYTPLYCVLAVLIALELQSSLEVVAGSNYLDPQRIRAAFASETNLPAWWEDEVEHLLDEKSSWLRWVSLAAPVFVVLTFVASVLQTALHVRAVYVAGGGLCNNPGHDKAISIVALPLIYCVMSFRSVGRMWEACVNFTGGDMQGIVDFRGQSSWLSRLVVRQNLYQTNFSVADLYEAVALYQFAALTLTVIRTSNLRSFSRAPTAEPTVLDVVARAERQQQSVETLTVQGIYLFILTCLLESLYYLGTTCIEMFAQNSGQKVPTHIMRMLKRVHSLKEKSHFFFLGMGTISSSAAIGNLVAVDMSMHSLLKAFHPRAKFWSVKVLVSLAFLQSLVLYVPPLSALSTTEGYLLYASALCIECFGVSLLLLCAWPPHEDWYHDLAADAGGIVRCVGSRKSVLLSEGETSEQEDEGWASCRHPGGCAVDSQDEDPEGSRSDSDYPDRGR